MFKKSKKTAFTLVELLVVIAIIGILSTLAVISLQNARSKARDAKRVADVRQIQTALELYYASEGKYPDDLKTGDSIESPDGTVYMPRFPKAPSTVESGCDSSEYHYEQKEAGASYEISFCLSSKIGDLEAGDNLASPGGIAPPPPPLQCSELTTLADCQGSCYYEGEEYPVVKIGNQCWFAKNLAYLPSVDNTQNTANPKYYVYDYNGTSTDAAKDYTKNEVNHYNTYGVLYNYPAALTACPAGWRLPDNNDWNGLEDFLSASPTYYCGSDSEFIAKSLAATTLWNSLDNHYCAIGDNLSANNSSGFTALPAGFRDADYGWFNFLSGRAFFWSASSMNNSRAWRRNLLYDTPKLSVDFGSRATGLSVRCLFSSP